MKKELNPFFYLNVAVKRVVDGDTIELIVDLGFGLSKTMTVRLYGIDTPEVYGKNACKEGRAASAFVKKLLPEGTAVTMTTFKDSKGKYGRYLAKLSVDGQDLGDILLASGHAKAAKY